MLYWTEIRLRPLARRRFRTVRPAFRRIRLRKPCFFWRRRGERWSVRFGINDVRLNQSLIILPEMRLFGKTHNIWWSEAVYNHRIWVRGNRGNTQVLHRISALRFPEKISTIGAHHINRCAAFQIYFALVDCTQREKFFGRCTLSTSFYEHPRTLAGRPR